MHSLPSVSSVAITQDKITPSIIKMNTFFSIIILMISLVLVPSFSKPQDHHLRDDKSTSMDKNKEHHEMQEGRPKDHQREKRTLSFLPDAEDAADFMDEIPGGEMGKKMLKALMKGGVPPQPVLVGFVEQPVPVQVAVPYPAPHPQPYYPPQ